MPRLLLTVQYLGTRYAGWQLQTNALTVQQVLEDALAAMFKEPIRVEGAGRTDSGVHAIAQRAHADVPSSIHERGFLQGINNRLPHDVRVSAMEEVASDFHCRFRAKRKRYRFQIWNASVEDVFAYETHAFCPGRLDSDAMAAAAVRFVGTHQFAPFTVAEPEVSSTIRTVDSVEVRREGRRVLFSISADGFLRYMVRRMAGSLMEIGRGNLDPQRLFEEARWTAPARGLVLEGIDYE